MSKKGKNLVASDKINLIGFLVLVFLFFCVAEISYAQEPGETIKFPSKPIKIIVPAAATGGLGGEIRLITPFVQKNLGVATVIEFISGAEGMIAYNKFYQEKPDGNTIMHFNLSSPIVLELTRGAVKYVVKDFSPIAAWNIKSHVLTVHSDSWKNFSEFVDDAKKRKISLAFMGGSANLQSLLLETALGVKFNLVPYEGAAEPLAAVAGKHVDAVLTFTMSPKPLIQAGKLRALAVFSPKPDPILPGVPIPKELGHDEIPLLVVYGMFAAPPNTPKKIVAILEKAIQNATADPEFTKLAKNAGLTIDFKSSYELNRLTLEHYEIINKYKQFIK